MKANMNTNEALAQFEAACWKYAHNYIKLATVRKLYDLEDLFSVGQMAVLKALETYDDSKGTALATHAINMIRWELGHLVRGPVTEAKRMGPMQSIETRSEDRTDFLHPATFDVSDDASDLFEELTSTLNADSREVVGMRLFEELTYAEMGERLGMSGVNARNLFEQAMLTVKSKAASFIA